MNRIVPQNEAPTEDGLRIEYWPIERLIPSARNARTHSAAQVHTLAETNDDMSRFGVMHPCGVGRSTEGDQKA
jgi:hypothetical protein